MVRLYATMLNKVEDLDDDNLDHVCFYRHQADGEEMTVVVDKVQLIKAKS